MTVSKQTTAHKNRQPRIWLVISNKLGDNSQVEIIAQQLGLPSEIRRVIPKDKYVQGKPWFKASLYHLDLKQSDPLEPPWPDIIITVGRRPSMAALWIKEQAQGQPKVILVGRPRRWIERYDLLIIPPQYRVPPLANVYRLQFPAMRPDLQRISKDAEVWRPRLSALKKPLLAVLIGGPTQPMRFDSPVTQKLIEQASTMAANGTLLITTSRRTPDSVVSELQKNLPANAQLFIWNADMTENPYHALLGLADHFMVTGDSISMMVEVACIGKPLTIFTLPETLTGKLWKRVQQILLPDTAQAKGLKRIGLMLYKIGILGFPRNLTAFHDELVKQGFASRLNTTFSAKQALATGKKIPSNLAGLRERILTLIE